MLFAKKAHIIPVINSADINAGVDADSINCAKVKGRVTYVLMFGTLTGDAVLTVYSGATDGSKDSALYFKYALGSAAVGSASSDILGTEAEVATLTLTAATYSNKMLVVEVDVHKMDMQNDEEWMTLSLSADASAGICEVIAIIDLPAKMDGGASSLTI